MDVENSRHFIASTHNSIRAPISLHILKKEKVIENVHDFWNPLVMKYKFLFLLQFRKDIVLLFKKFLYFLSLSLNKPHTNLFNTAIKDGVCNKKLR